MRNRPWKGMMGLAVWLSLVLAPESVGAQERVIRFGTEGAFAPFNYLDGSGKPVGFDIDIGEALCRELKAKCVWVVQDWDGLIPALLTKKVDAILASMLVTEERKKRVNFTSTYWRANMRFLVRKGAELSISPQGLSGKTIGVQRATQQSTVLARDFGAASIREYDTQTNANIDLEAGRLDAVFADSALLYSWLKENNRRDRFELVGDAIRDPLLDTGCGIATRLEDKALLQDLNTALTAIIKDGRYEAINKKYFPFSIL